MLVVAVYLVACGEDDPAGVESSGNGNGQPITTSDLDVAVQDNRFSPEGLRVPKDSTVTWTWEGSHEHNVTFDDGFATSDTKSTGTFSWTFSQPGIFSYFCSVHGASEMAGEIGVQ